MGNSFSPLLGGCSKPPAMQVDFLHFEGNMQYTHIGWTPCINGHLNFGLMTPGIFGGFTNISSCDAKRTAINYGFKAQDDHHARRIIIQSKVDWKDTPNSETDGNFRVILTAETNETNNLDDRHLWGTVYIYPLKAEPPKNDGKIDLPWFDLIHKSNDLISNYRNMLESEKSNESWTTTQRALNKNYEDLSFCLKNKDTHPIKEHFYKVKFYVNSRGMTELKMDIESNPRSDYIILRQAFYYIKYSLHSHKHHHAAEDSLTTIVQKESSEDTKNEVGLRIIGQLKRELTAIKRTYSSGGNKVFHDEQGIIAYMNSLYKSLHKDNYLTTEQYDRETIYLKSIKESFKVQIEKQTKKNEKEKEIKNTARTYLALTLTITSILWLTVLQHFTTFSTIKVNSKPIEFAESIIYFFIILSCLIATYKFQTKKIIKNTLDTEGLRTWVEQYYITKDNEFKKKITRSRILAITIIIVTALFFFFTPLVIGHLNKYY
ncbi:hypothetical protein [Shewanella chilikensis]|uniref:hypothetical protein n=1 Tax=Shewanella chilikensis TaxID=558541 RepID=UPI0030D5AB29